MGTPTVPIDSEFSVTVRILPKGDELELELPASSTGKMIKDSLLEDEELGLHRIDPEGNPYIYNLVSKGMGKTIGDEVSLYEAGVKDGDTLIVSPELVAGKNDFSSK